VQYGVLTGVFEVTFQLTVQYGVLTGVFEVTFQHISKNQAARKHPM
jgi:hypothetical protein